MVPQQIAAIVMQQKGVVGKVALALLVAVQVLVRFRPGRTPILGEDDYDCGGVGAHRCAELQLFSTWQKTIVVDSDVTPVLDAMEPLNLTALDFHLGTSFRGGLTPERFSTEVRADGAVVFEALQHERPEELDLLHFRNGSGIDDAEGLLVRHRSAGDHVSDGSLRVGEPIVRPAEMDRAALYEEFDRQAERITKSLAGGGELTPWGRQLEELQGDMEARMAQLPSHRKSAKQVSTTTPAPVQSTVLQEINDLLRQMCQDVRHRDSKACKPLLEAFSTAHIPVQMASPEERQRELDEELKALADDHAAWQKEFDDKVTATHKELCEDPSRRDRPDCIEFLASITKQEGGKHRELHDAHQASLTVLRSNVKQEIKERAAILERKLSEIVAERRAWETELLNKYGLGENVHHGHHNHHSQQEEPAAPSADDSNTLHWSAVESWSLNGRLRGSLQRHNNRTVLHRRDLLSARWAGRIPKVACITAFKSGVAARIQLKYFIENFRMQRYEGASQLVLVYHSKDHEAAKLAALYADGAFIKAVASQSEESEFPSTTDLRYAAWTAKDADVIAQWTFSEWHHPDRLSLQVRAMGYSARPACVFRSTSNATQLTAGVDPADESIAGEAAWMTQHWHPWLQEQSAVLHSAQAFQIVELDMFGRATK